MLQLPPPLAPLASRVQFVTWFAAPIADKPGKFNKFPARWDGLTLDKDGRRIADGGMVDAQDPANWCDATTALANHARWDRGHGSGIGFVFTENDPYFFLDIDGHWDPDEAKWSDLALELCARLPGAAVEVSYSGIGLHVFGRYTGPAPDHAKRNTPLHLELYTSKRFVALTGTNAVGDIETDLTGQLQLIMGQFFAPSPTGDFAGWTTEPVEGWDGPTDDDVLIEKALKSGQRNAQVAFGGKVSFKALWEADVDVLAKQWPGEEGKLFGQSEADMALANHLAYWTGKNCERMERLMRRSALARPKWDNHRTYLGEKTILRACAFVSNVAKPKEAPAQADQPPAADEQTAAVAQAVGRTLRDRAEYMGPTDQLAYFAGCYFLSDHAKIFCLHRNSIMPKASFDVVYGGYLFVLDPLGSKTTTSAWEAFTLSRVNVPVIVDDLCFRPELPVGAVAREGTRALVNSYVPYFCPVLEGDPSPVLDLLAKQFPVEEDRRILVNWMASYAQNPGRKFQWWPVLQGVKGNGKTFLLTLLKYIAGEQYSHLPNAHAMAKNGLQFNSWVWRKLFIGVEEISLTNKRDFLDEFKVIVTNESIPLEGKGSNQITGDNRANGILCTNFKDGVPIDADERRYAIFYMAQQMEADLTRDGMEGDYFPKLWDWFRRGGAAVFANYLKTFQIEAAYDPAGLSHRAPKTSSTGAAIANSRGRAEQEILEAIEEGRPGFNGGWVSSFYLDTLLDGMRVAIPRNRRRQMMIDLGYDWHPALHDGRVNDIVTPDGRKPKLYVKNGHIAHLNLTRPADIAKAYSKAQEPGTPDVSAAVIAFATPALTPPSK